jgi:cytosine/adenosine deaminase-related metal-dependent hydrolase
MSVRIVVADAIIPGEEPPIRDGALCLEQDGRILDVGKSAELLARYAGAQIESVRGVLLPGLVNAHAHVELSALRGTVQGGAGFVPWVENMLAARAAQAPEQDDDAIERAAGELETFGTVAVGEVTNTLAAVRALAGHGIGGIVFHEVFGLDRTLALQRVTKLEQDAKAPGSGIPAPDFDYVPAPHTVYTTHPDAIRAILRTVREQGARTTIHLAEHGAERTFLHDGSGPFRDFVAKMRFSTEGFAVPGKGPIHVAADLGLLAPDVVLVHLTDARPDELDLVAQSRAPVVLCPRSNLFIEVKLPPLNDMLRAGIVPALGTDSLASNLSLDLLAEAKALGDRFPAVPKAMLLRMATAAGADALGRADLGRLQRGKRPGVIAVFGPLGAGEDPCEFVLQKPANQRRWINHRPLSLFPSRAPGLSRAPGAS